MYLFKKNIKKNTQLFTKTLLQNRILQAELIIRDRLLPFFSPMTRHRTMKKSFSAILETVSVVLKLIIFFASPVITVYEKAE